MISSVYNFSINQVIEDARPIAFQKNGTKSDVLLRIMGICLDSILSKISDAYVNRRTDLANRQMHKDTKGLDIVHLFDFILKGDVVEVTKVDPRIEEIARQYWKDLESRKKPTLMQSLGNVVKGGFTELCSRAVDHLYGKVYTSSKVTEKNKIRAGLHVVQGGRLLVAWSIKARESWNEGHKVRAAKYATAGLANGVLGILSTAVAWMK